MHHQMNKEFIALLVGMFEYEIQHITSGQKWTFVSPAENLFPPTLDYYVKWKPIVYERYASDINRSETIIDYMVALRKDKRHHHAYQLELRPKKRPHVTLCNGNWDVVITTESAYKKYYCDGEIR